MDALLVIDKPAGITSHDVVSRVRRLLGERSIGHLGTLDPMATGVLPLLLGRYTRLAQFFRAADKTYEGQIRFGFATDTYDADGKAIGAAQPVQVTLERLRDAAAEFVGEIAQQPPKFSAKKIAGVPAYKLARKNQEVELKAVKINVRRFEIHSLEGERARFTAEVSAGTYVRSLAHELGAKLGIGAHLSELRRTKSGEFDIAQAISLPDLDELVRDRNSNEPLNEAEENSVARIAIHPRSILLDLPSVTVTEESAALIANGRAVNLPEFSSARQVKVFLGKDRLIGIASRIAGTLFQPKVVLNVGVPSATLK
jgi:tRNA pseudouridine55 synthase